MFTMFHGFHLVEEYHQWKKDHRNSRNPIEIKVLKLIFAICIPLFFWIAPSSAYGLSGLTPVEHRVLAIFVLFIPILAIAGSSMTEQLSSFGGVSTLLIGVAICSSVAMVLPISTPPNALADATGFIQQKYMVKTGLIMGCVGLLLGYIVLIICGINGIF